jgi:hypothetical protein
MSPTNGGDDDLRRALHDAVADVEPHDALAQIRSRTNKVVPMNRRWLLPTLAAAAVMAVVIGGAFWINRDNDNGPGASGTPTPSVSPSEDPSSGPTPTDTTNRAVPVYYVGATANGHGLYREFQKRPVCRAADCLLKASTVQAIAGTPIDGDYTSPWPSGTGLNAASYDGDTLTIDLSGNIHDRPAGMSQADAELAVQQLIYSAQAGLGQGRPPVQLLIDGSHTDQVLGVPASEPLAAANADDVLAPVQIDAPEQGATVSSPVRVTGRAAVFEANVVWEVLVGGDAVVKHGFTMATECCTLSPYSFTVDLDPGTYTLVVHDSDESGEGRPVNQDTKEFTVQ